MSDNNRRAALPPWLHSRYVPAFGLVLGALLLALAMGFLIYERLELQAATTARGELYARVLEDQASRTFNSVELVLSTTGETSASLRASQDFRRLTALLLQSMQTLPFLRSVSLVDGSGRILASSSPANVGRVIHREALLQPGLSAGLGPSLPGRDLADLADQADQAVTPGTAPAATEAPGGTAGSPAAANLLPLVRPLAPGTEGDWLVATLNPDYFANQFSLLLVNTPLRAALLSYGGQLLVPGEGSTHAAGKRLSAHPVFTQQLSAGREHGQTLGAGIDGEVVFTAYRTLRRHPVVLLVETPDTALRNELQAVALNVAIGTAVVLLVLGATAGLAWRSLRSHEAVSGDLLAARGSMAAQHAFTDRLFQVSPIPMVVKDTNGRFLQVNKAWTDFTGMPPERLVGHNMGRLYPAQLAAPHEVQEQMAIASGQPVTYEEQMLDSDGLPRDVMIRLVPFTDVDGQTAGVIGCLMDVTEFREAAQRTIEAKEAAERSNAAKSEFLANISHELRTPLQSILGFSELGTLRARADPRLQGMFGDIHAAGQRMLSLVNNLLDLSRLESTVGEVHLKTIDIVPSLRSVVAELRQLAAGRSLRLVAPEHPGADGPLWARADDFRLQQVLRNVLANAIRFAPAGSQVDVDWGHSGDDAPWVRVRDHGPGVPASELETIFEAFVQSSRTKDGSGGTGLGLAICRKIMHAHHGQIIARNHPGGGAVFEIHLPACPAPPAAGASSNTAVAAG
jgi:PAS domain S-box-containing protein